METLLQQSEPADVIVMNLPKVFARTQETYSIPDWLKPLVEARRVQINPCEDWGPATKLIPTLGLAADDDIIITVDDDHLYPLAMVKRLKEASEAAPTSAHGASGDNFEYFQTVMVVENGEKAQMLEGFAGVAYRASFFRGAEWEAYANKFLNITECRFSDDVVISNWLALNKVARRTVQQPDYDRDDIEIDQGRLHFGRQSDALHQGANGACQPHNVLEPFSERYYDCLFTLKAHGALGMELDDKKNHFSPVKSRLLPRMSLAVELSGDTTCQYCGQKVPLGADVLRWDEVGTQRICCTQCFMADKDGVANVIKALGGVPTIDSGRLSFGMLRLRRSWRKTPRGAKFAPKGLHKARVLYPHRAYCDLCFQQQEPDDKLFHININQDYCEACYNKYEYARDYIHKLAKEDESLAQQLAKYRPPSNLSKRGRPVSFFAYVVHSSLSTAESDGHSPGYTNPSTFFRELMCEFPRSTEASTPIDIELIRALDKKNFRISSQCSQDLVLVLIFKAIGALNNYFVEFGARRPEVLNSTHFKNNCSWSGLLLDGAPGQATNRRKNYFLGFHELLDAPDAAKVRLRKAFITAGNINDVLNQHEVPKEFDLLTVDVNYNGYWLLKALDMESYSPRVIAVGFSSYWFGNEAKVVKYKADATWPGHSKWSPRSVTGASLAALNKMLRAKGYCYVVTSGGEHAMFCREDVLPPSQRDIPIPDKVEQGWQFDARVLDKEIDMGNWVDV